MMLSYSSTKEEPSTNGLKDSSDDPAIPMTDTASSPPLFGSDVYGLTSFRPSISGLLADPITADVYHHGSVSRDWPTQEQSQEQSDETIMDTFINWDDDNAATNPAVMQLGPPQDSDSPSSSSPSEKQQSSDGSGRPSFSGMNIDTTTATNHGLPEDWSMPAPALDNSFPFPSSLDTMNEMTLNLAVQSTKHSPTENLDMLYSDDQLPAFAMPYELSPNEAANNPFTNDPYREASLDSSEASPIMMNPLRRTPHAFHGLQEMGVTSYHHMGQPQTLGYHRLPHSNPDLRSSAQSQTSPTGAPKQKYQEYIPICQDFGPEANRMFCIKANKTTTRVETSIDVRLILKKSPAGIKRLRVHADHLNKAKQLKDKDAPLTPDTLELHATVFCDTAVQTTERIEAAFKRAASPETEIESPGDEKNPLSNEGHKPIEPSPVKICDGCVTREAKRLNRGKQKPEDTDTVDRRTLVFNSSPIMDWRSAASTNARDQLLAHQEPACTTLNAKKSENSKNKEKLPTPPIEKGTIAIDLPMRPCCYCRHQKEPNGFRIILTLRDHRGEIYAQRMTLPIMITDDHKDKEKKEFVQPAPAMFDGPPLPGQFMFHSNAVHNQTALQQSLSTPELATWGQNPYVMPVGIRNPQQFSLSHGLYTSNRNSTGSHNMSGIPTPETLSRQDSPTDGTERHSKKRKAHALGGHCGEMSQQLQMTPIKKEAQNSHAAGHSLGNFPNGAAVAARRPVQNGVSRSNRHSNSHHPRGSVTNPPSPNHANDGLFYDVSQSINTAESFSMPTSNYQSRAHSPHSGRRGHTMDFQPEFSHQLQDQLRNVQTTDVYPQPRPKSQRRVPPLTPQPTPLNLVIRPEPSGQLEILSITPNSGPLAGGERCHFVGKNFHSDLQIFFGERPSPYVECLMDTMLWCTVPPSHQTGAVRVHFVPTNPQQLPSPSGEQTTFYHYKEADYAENNAPQTLQTPSQHQSFENYYDDSQGFPSYPNNTAWPYAHQTSLPQHHYTSSGGQGLAETPPAYEDIFAGGDQRAQEIKRRSMLSAVGDVLADEKAREYFENTNTAAESSKVPTTSKSMSHVTIGRNAISEEEREKLRLERSQNMKGLRSDRKLWMIWVPILILVIAMMCYDHFPQAWHMIILVLAWIRDTIFPGIRATIGALGDIPRRIQQDRARIMGPA